MSFVFLYFHLCCKKLRQNLLQLITRHLPTSSVVLEMLQTHLKLSTMNTLNSFTPHYCKRITEIFTKKTLKMSNRSPLLSLVFIFLLLLHCFIPHAHSSDECIELTRPVLSDVFVPSCSLLLIQQDFADTEGWPPASAFYSPPSDCPGPWSHVIIEFHASCQGKQYNRMAGVWLARVEILRTSTAVPTDSGIFWKVRKDVTRYSSLLLRSGITLTVMLENVVDDVFDGVYNVNVSLLYFGGSKPRAWSRVSNRKVGFVTEKTVDPIGQEGIPGFKDGEFARNSNERLGFRSQVRKLGFVSNETRGRTAGREKAGLLNEKPADLIIPISDDGDEGFWFRIKSESDVLSKKIRIPRNAYRAVLEIYMSYHGNDEFWYSNPPDPYFIFNNGNGNDSFRQVFAKIDGVFVGSAVPFPVIYTGAFIPLLWKPFVAIGAFNLPSYDIDLTPFLALILDGKKHSFVLGVTGCNPFWLVDANLHIWLDSKSSVVHAKTLVYKLSPLIVRRESVFENLDRSFGVDARRITHFSGWVHSRAGNFTTLVVHQFRFKNSISLRSNEVYKKVKQKVKIRTDVRVMSGSGTVISRASFKRRCPLKIITWTLPASDNNRYLFFANVSHALSEKNSYGDEHGSSLSNTQDSGGWMAVRDQTVLFGSADTRQRLVYEDDFSRFSQTVAASNGKILEVDSTVTSVN